MMTSGELNGGLTKNMTEELNGIHVESFPLPRLPFFDTLHSFRDIRRAHMCSPATGLSWLRPRPCGIRYGTQAAGICEPLSITLRGRDSRSQCFMKHRQVPIYRPMWMFAIDVRLSFSRGWTAARTHRRARRSRYRSRRQCSSHHSRTRTKTGGWGNLNPTAARRQQSRWSTRLDDRLPRYAAKAAHGGGGEPWPKVCGGLYVPLRSECKRRAKDPQPAPEKDARSYLSV